MFSCWLAKPGWGWSKKDLSVLFIINNKWRSLLIVNNAKNLTAAVQLSLSIKQARFFSFHKPGCTNWHMPLLFPSKSFPWLVRQVMENIQEMESRITTNLLMELQRQEKRWQTFFFTLIWCRRTQIDQTSSYFDSNLAPFLYFVDSSAILRTAQRSAHNEESKHVDQSQLKTRPLRKAEISQHCCYCSDKHKLGFTVDSAQ